MKKVLVIALVLCLALTAVVLVACNNTDVPDGALGYAEASVSGGKATLIFESKTEWKLEVTGGAWFKDEWNPWQKGTCSFEGKVGESTLHMTATKESENTFIKDKAVGEEATYEPTNGVYTIVFSINGSDTTFQFKPNADNSEQEPEKPEEKVTAVTLNATDAVTTYTAAIKVYTDGTFDFELAGQKVFGGEWTSTDTTGENPFAPVTLTVDSTGSAIVGNTITVTITPSQDYSSMTYTCHVDYVVPEQITMAFDFTGTLVISTQQPEEKVAIVTLNATDAATTYAAAIKIYEDGTFDFELAGQKVFGGEWASTDTTGQNPMADVTATPDETGAAVVGNSITITITPSQDFTSMTYACHVDYVVPQTITMALDFTGTLALGA